MDFSTLKLVIEKGPREGETLEFNSKPGFTIRIGRVVRGNTFAIKDNGISSKHLSIECCSQDKWVVKDLDSSNGSFLNSSALPPLTVHDLCDGDVLKIGEVTSIRVRISHVSDSQPMGRNLRSGARVLGTGNSDDAQKVPEEGNRRGRGRGRGRGGVNVGDEGLGIEVPDFIASVDLEEENGRGRGRGRGKGDAKSGDEGLGLEVPASAASVHSEANTETNVPEVGFRRGRSQGRGEIVLQKPELNSEIPENVEGFTQKGGPVSKRRTRSSKKEVDKVEIVGESSEKGGDMEFMAEPAISLRRTTRSRGMKNKDNSALTSALERIPEASQLVGSNKCEVLEDVAPAVKRNTRVTRGRKKKEVEMESAQSVIVGDKGGEEELNEGEQISTEHMPNIVEEGERLASEQISEQENRHEMEIVVEIVVVKPEPQSNVDGIVSKGEHPSKESMSEIVQKDGDLACQLNFEHETRDELEANLNQDDRREPECDTEGVDFQESTAASGAATDKNDEAELAPDLNKMTLGEWLDYLERFLPKQIRTETDQIIQDLQKRSQQFHEFMLEQQKDKGTLPLG